MMNYNCKNLIPKRIKVNKMEEVKAMKMII